ncbi:24595_t:CDS:2, partial [Gigaspora margarita]
ENDAAIFYNYVKNRPFPYGPENIEIQFLPSKDENDEHRNKRSKDEALSETNVYELPDNSKKSKKSEDKILNRTDELFKNSNKKTREILNPQYALYENREQYVIVIYIPGIGNEDQLKIRFSQAKKNLEISGEFQPLRSERVLKSTISTGPFVLNLCLEKE